VTAADPGTGTGMTTSSSPRPVIGVTASVDPASWRFWRDVPAALVPYSYVRHLHAAGGIAVGVAPLPDDASEDDARSVLDRLDGLIISGGVDVDPARYGQERHPSVQRSSDERDRSELMLAAVATRDDVPLLGVCRGMQVMAVAAGGSLEQHLPDRVAHMRHSPEVGRYGSHEIQILDGTRLYDILGADVSVATYHHQGVDEIAAYRPTAWADDGVVEALEDPDALFCIGVQWHPEAGDDPRLFEHLVAAAREHAARRH
jgi:putative glutamine amidotransferase